MFYMEVNQKSPKKREGKCRRDFSQLFPNGWGGIGGGEGPSKGLTKELKLSPKAFVKKI